MVRQHHSADVDAWITEVQHTGVKALRAFVTGVLKDTAAVRAGLSLILPSSRMAQTRPP
jgi:hypothetical protein